MVIGENLNPAEYPAFGHLSSNTYSIDFNWKGLCMAWTVGMLIIKDQVKRTKNLGFKQRP